MGLKHAVLAALLEGEASGYELSKRFDVGVANFWSATPQQLYRELNSMEHTGWVAGRVVEQRRRPNKRLFSLTEEGLEELCAFTARPARPMVLRDDLVVKLHAIDVGDVEAVTRALEERYDQALAKLALYERLEQQVLGGSSEEEYIQRCERIGPYLTLSGGRMLEQQNLRWIASVLHVLDVRARGDER